MQHVPDRPLTKGLNRRIFALAFPALGSLIAEPIFIAIDTAMVGHLGSTQLAGLGIASAILQTAVGLMVFLAYATTPFVARHLGAGNMPAALRAGIDGMALATALGLGLAAFIGVLGPWFVKLFHVEHAVTEAATTYLTISALGIPAMMLVYAATGLLRGLQDTTTPLIIAVSSFAVNAGLNAILIYGLGLGIAGSAIGTVIAQWAMVAAYAVVISRILRRHHVSAIPALTTLRHISVTGGWLFLRTLSLRAALLSTVAVAAVHSTTATAAFQIVFTLYTFLAFALDALAIAAQTLIGYALGSGERDTVRQLVSRTVWLGVACGAGLAAATIAANPLIGRVFSQDPEVLGALPWAFVVFAVTLPIQGVVYVLDGVLMGAADARYLALAGVVNIIVYAPTLAWVWVSSANHSATFHVVALTAVYSGVYMLARMMTLLWRAHGNRWIDNAMPPGAAENATDKHAPGDRATNG